MYSALLGVILGCKIRHNVWVSPGLGASVTIDIFLMNEGARAL